MEFEEYFEANIESLSWIVSLKMGTVGFGSRFIFITMQHIIIDMIDSFFVLEESISKQF